MAAGAAGASVIGTAIQIKGNNDRAKAQRSALHENANLKRIQALEILDRADINADNIRKRTAQFKGTQRTTFASRGVDVSSGTPLNILEETDSIAAAEISNSLREAEFTADQVRRGAAMDIQEGKDIVSQTKTQNLSAFLSGAGAAISAGSR